MTMEKIWDVTIMKMGSIQIEAETEDEAAKLAGDLTALNQSRKALTEEGKEAAIRIVEETEIGQDSWNAVDVCKI